MANKKVALRNLGCKVNSYELEAVTELLKAYNYEIVPFEPGAELYIINTCSVTNVADRKSRQMLHKAKQMNPDATVIAMGCYAQAEADQLMNDDCVDIVIGNNKKKDIIEIIKTHIEKNSDAKYLEDVMHNTDYEYLEVSSLGDKSRGFIKVQDGCNQFCSYCIIPYTRGHIRSRSIEDTLKEVTRLAEAGCQEVILSGIHLSSYGRDIKLKNGLLELIEAVSEVEGIERIRLGSLEPGIITEEFAEALSKNKKICPHFHLSMQSGSSKILKAMNRRYDTDEFKERCEILRKYFDRPAITTDIIAGFPGETEEDFQTTYNFTDEISFFETHVFPFSKRKGTKAADMPGQLSNQEKKDRANKLIALNSKKHKEWFDESVGHEIEVLVEEKQLIDGEEYWVGHSRHYEKTAIKSDMDLRHKIVKVIPYSHNNDCLLAIY